MKQGKKDKLVQFLISSEEFQVLRGLLKTSQYRGMSELLRAMVFNRRITILTKDTNLHKLLYELSKIGANINQIAKRCNIDAIGGQSVHLKFSEKYIISKAISIMEETLNKVI